MPLDVEAAKEKAKAMFCPACGRQVPDDSVFCPGCGNDMSAARQITQQMQPTGPGMPGANPNPRKSSAGLIVALVVGGVVLLLLFVLAGVFAFRAFLSPKLPLPLASTSTSAATTTSATSAAKGSSTPEAAVDAWFTAVAKADMAAVKRTATPSFAAAIEPGMFEGRDPNTSYRVVSTQTADDSAIIDVQESPSNAPAQTTTTFTLAKQVDGTWLVAGYAETATGQTVGTTPPASTQTPSPATPAAPAFRKADAIDVVGRFLNDLKSGNGKLAKKLATSRFKNANPGWIYGPLTGFEFEVVGAKKKNSTTWIVTTDERWVSGDERGTYTVVVKSGKGYVDRRNGLE
jgi:hypothetical protein